MGDRIKVIMDCDPGIDDGIALAYAAAHQDELELLAITTFAGNATIDKVTKNALELVDFYGLNVPVAKGQERPLVREALHAEEFHGETGLGHCVLPETKTEIASDNAVLFIREWSSGRRTGNDDRDSTNDQSCTASEDFSGGEG